MIDTSPESVWKTIVSPFGVLNVAGNAPGAVIAVLVIIIVPVFPTLAEHMYRP